MAETLLVLIVAVYAAVATAYVEARRRREAAPRWARILGPVGVVVHFTGLSALAASAGRSPFGTPAEALSFLAFSIVAVYLLLEVATRVASNGGSFYWLATLLAGISVPGMIHGDGAAAAPDLQRTLHIGLSLLGTSAVLVSGLLAGGYLTAYYRVKRGTVRPGTQGLALSEFQKLTRGASFLAAVLLLPSLSLGIGVAFRNGAPAGLPWLTAFVAVLFLLMLVSWLIWWRRPVRGASAAWMNVAATILLILAVAVIHPLVLGS